MELISESYGSESESESEDLEEKVQKNKEHIVKVSNKVLYKNCKDCIVSPMNNYLSVPLKTKVRCFFFLEIRLMPFQQRVLDRALVNVNKTLHSFGQNVFEPNFRGKLGAPKPLHVSLSPAIFFDNEMEFKNCISRVRSKLQVLSPYNIPVKFKGTWALYPNFDSSIWFLSLPCDDETKRLALPILQIINEITNFADDTTHQNFVDNLHMSVASAPNQIVSLGFNDREKQEKKLLLQRNILQTHAGAELPVLRSELNFSCCAVKIQSGANMLSVQLN